MKEQLQGKLLILVVKKSILNLIRKKKLAKKGVEVGTSSNRVVMIWWQQQIQQN